MNFEPLSEAEVLTLGQYPRNQDAGCRDLNRSFNGPNISLPCDLFRTW